MSKLEGELLAKAISKFLSTELGEQFLTTLSLHYNDLHHQAEDVALTAEQKAMKVERAAGVKWCIDYLTQRQKNLEDGYWAKK